MPRPPTTPSLVNITFRVTTPAQAPGPVLVPDPTPHYNGTTMNFSMLPPTVGSAVIKGGSLVGSTWVACTYTSGQYSIPGMGEISQG